MSFNIEQFKARFRGGARPYLFYVKPDIPNFSTEEATYMVMSSSLPGREIAADVSNWQGMEFKTAGKSTYSTWDTTFRVDNDARIRQAFENWMYLIHDPITNFRTPPMAYMRDQIVQLLSDNGVPVRTYRLIGAWPSSVAGIDLDYGGDGIASFAVTFTYQYHISGQSGRLSGW